VKWEVYVINAQKKGPYGYLILTGKAFSELRKNYSWITKNWILLL